MRTQFVPNRAERSLEHTRPRREDPSEEVMRRTGWLALAGVSIAVLLSAVFAPENLDAALAAIGFAGLVVFRLTAARAGWVPQRGGRSDAAAGRADNGAPGQSLRRPRSRETERRRG